MQRYALIDENGNVDNIVMWDGSTSWTLPTGYTAVATDKANIGWTYTNGNFVEPPAPPLGASPTPPTVHSS